MFDEGSRPVQMWELSAIVFWLSNILPVAPGCEEHQDAIRRARGDAARAVADPLKANDDREREIARKERLNIELMF